MTTMDAGVSALGQGKVVLINMALPREGSSTGALMRLVGGSADLRVDLFDVGGTLRGSCFLVASDRRCDLGSPSTIYPNLSQDPRYFSGASQYSAFDMVSANLSFTGSLAGSALQDSYVVSVSTSASGLRFDVVGVFYTPDDDRGANSSMRPVYATGVLSLAEMATLASGSVWTLPSSRNAPTP
jgi:hypothetical protein